MATKSISEPRSYWQGVIDRAGGGLWKRTRFAAGVLPTEPSGRLSYSCRGTGRQGRPDSAPPGLADRTFFFGSRNLPDLSGSTPRLAGYLRRVIPGLRPPSPPPGS